MKKYDKPGIIRRMLGKLKPATKPGKSADGQMVQVRYEVGRAPTAQAKLESSPARRQGLDLRVFTGHLDRVWKAKTGGLCFTVLALERIGDGARYCYRTFNMSLGRVRWVKVL